jgi:hypothetical protein
LDPLVVRHFERFGNPCDRQRLLERDGAASDPMRQVLAFDQLHHQRMLPPDLLESVNRRDVVIGQRREQLGLRVESAPRGRGRG